MYSVHHQWLVYETHLGIAPKHLEPHHPVFLCFKKLLERKAFQYLFCEAKTMGRHVKVDVPLQQQILISKIVLRQIAKRRTWFAIVFFRKIGDNDVAFLLRKGLYALFQLCRLQDVVAV